MRTLHNAIYRKYSVIGLFIAMSCMILDMCAINDTFYIKDAFMSSNDFRSPVFEYQFFQKVMTVIF